MHLRCALIEKFRVNQRCIQSAWICGRFIFFYVVCVSFAISAGTSAPLRHRGENSRSNTILKLSLILPAVTVSTTPTFFTNRRLSIARN